MPVRVCDVVMPPQSLSAPRSPRFVFARELGRRAEEINALYNRFTGKSRTLDAYHWEFYRNAAGPALIWTITEAATGRIVGHHSIIPTPLVERGTLITGGRTENTIVDRGFRHKIFYPGMEKKALAEALQTFRVLYTVRANAFSPGPLRRRFGYKPVGRWTVYLARIGPEYLRGLLERAVSRRPGWRPDLLLTVVAQCIGRAYRAGSQLGRRSVPWDVAEASDVTAFADEYERFWGEARERYDLTIDRSLGFLRWRFRDNPHLKFRTWTFRREGRLQAVVIGHAHTLGNASALYVDDIIVGEYEQAVFHATLACLPKLAPELDAIVVMTLATDTPLHRALQRRFPLQSFLLGRLGPKLFDEMLALDQDGTISQPWYVTPIFTEGVDTSRNERSHSGPDA
jgi:hypothetical protein